MHRINDAVCRLDWSQVEHELNPPDGSDGTPFELCAATRDHWRSYVESEEQALRSRLMAWCDGNVLIVELPGNLHADVVASINHAVYNATGTGDNHLAHHGDGFIRPHRDILGADVSALLAELEPDCSFGPRNTIPGAQLPQGFSWRMFHTLKVELGISQTWGGRCGLDFKADAWPGGLNVCQYRVDSILNGEFQGPRMLITNIDNNSVLTFDAWRLLGLPPGANLPAGFNNPVTFNLFDTIERNLAEERQDTALLEQARKDREAAVDAAAGQRPRRRRRLQ